MNKPILDDTEKIFVVDKSRTINYYIDSPKHYRRALEITQDLTVNYPKPSNIIVAGMGGSAIGGDLLKDWAKDKLHIPIEVNREYHLPKYADEKTLVIVSSYSGDTEETLSAFLEALRRGCMVFCITSGGALLEAADKRKVPHLEVPGGMPPRAALPYMFIPALVLLEKLGLVEGVGEELKEAYLLLEKIVEENGPEKPAVENFAKNTAYYIGDSAPAVYGFGVYRGVAQRFKQQFNENSKSAAKWDVFPELDHNEIVGWSGKGEQCRCFSAIFIRDTDEPVEIETRIETTKNIMEQVGLITFELDVQGKSLLAKMLSTIVVGDFLSVYLAVLRGVDPTPVPTIDYLKNVLKEHGFREKVVAELEKI